MFVDFVFFVNAMALPFCFIVSEWQGDKEGSRSVKVKFDESKRAILLFAGASRGRPTRTVDCKNVKKMYLKESVDRNCNYLLIRVAQDYDLVSMNCDFFHQLLELGPSTSKIRVCWAAPRIFIHCHKVTG